MCHLSSIIFTQLVSELTDEIPLNPLARQSLTINLFIDAARCPSDKMENYLFVGELSTKALKKFSSVSYSWAYCTQVTIAISGFSLKVSNLFAHYIFMMKREDGLLRDI